MSSYLPITLREIPEPDCFRYEVCEERVIETIEDPGPERMHLEEDAFLSELVELWVAVEQTG